MYRRKLFLLSLKTLYLLTLLPIHYPSLKEEYSYLSWNLCSHCPKDVYKKSMKWEECANVFDVSITSISRICNKKKRLRKDLENCLPPAKWGRKLPLIPLVLTFILIELEKNSQLRLKDIQWVFLKNYSLWQQYE